MNTNRLLKLIVPLALGTLIVAGCGHEEPAPTPLPDVPTKSAAEMGGADARPGKVKSGGESSDMRPRG